MNGETGYHTRREIKQQPLVWKKTYEVIRKRKECIASFLDKVFDNDNVDVILTGAGSSAFIGEAARGILLHRKDILARPVSTTDIVTHPKQYLSNEKRTLLVSFARSGNSPESVAVVDIVNNYCREVFHIIITCNSEGKLYIEGNAGNSLKILLPKETIDASLAMTSSFTSMMLAYVLIARIDTIEEEKEHIDRIARWITHVLENEQEKIKELAQLDFERAVFLGSGPLVGIARESHLKLQELTDGQVICKFDTFLGFRHGPKAVINNKTLIVYLLSDESYARQYEIDLIQQVNLENKGMAQVIISKNHEDIPDFHPRLDISYSDSSKSIAIEYLGIAHVVFAQLLGYYKSLHFGLNPDKPSVSGTISRVVEGVTIYNNHVFDKTPSK